MKQRADPRINMRGNNVRYFPSTLPDVRTHQLHLIDFGVRQERSTLPRGATMQIRIEFINALNYTVLWNPGVDPRANTACSASSIRIATTRATSSSGCGSRSDGAGQRPQHGEATVTFPRPNARRHVDPGALAWPSRCRRCPQRLQRSRLSAASPPDAIVAAAAPAVPHRSGGDRRRAGDWRDGRAGSIRIKPGTYREVVHVPRGKAPLALVGDDPARTTITFDRKAIGSRARTAWRSARFGRRPCSSKATTSSIENLTIENGAGPVGQAVALRVDGDRVDHPQLAAARLAGHAAAQPRPALSRRHATSPATSTSSSAPPPRFSRAVTCTPGATAI